MLETILDAFNEEVKQKFAEMEEILSETFDFSAIEQILSEIMNRFAASVLLHFIHLVDKRWVLR